MPETTATTPAERLADLTAQLDAARRELADATRATNPVINQLPRDPDPSQSPDALFARRRAADARVQRLTAQVELARADAYEALETDNQALLTDLGAGLAEARDRLADAAQAAVAALGALMAAAEGYRQQVDATRGRLGAAGFDGITRNQLIGSGFDTGRFPTRDAGSRLHINGVAWPATLTGGAPLAWVVERAASAAGPAGGTLAGFARSLIAADRAAVDELMEGRP